jgi:hypothetical protein
MASCCSSFGLPCFSSAVAKKRPFSELKTLSSTHAGANNGKSTVAATAFHSPLSDKPEIPHQVNVEVVPSTNKMSERLSN